MVKFLIGLLIVALLAVVGYYRFSAEPLDSRQAIETGVKQVKDKTSLSPEQEMLLKVQLAISDYMATNGSAPASLADLVPKYFDQEPKDPVTGQPFPYRREGKMPKLGAQATQVAGVPKQPSSDKTDKTGKGNGKQVELASADGFVNPNTMAVDDFVYDRTGKRDPFEPFDLSAAPAPVEGSSLVAYSLGQLRLTAVVVAPSGERKGLVEDSTGHGYTVNVGTRIGNEGGSVVEIGPDNLKVVITKTDFTGKETQNVTEMKIVHSGPSGQKKVAPAAPQKR